jgi:hypothetical protein
MDVSMDIVKELSSLSVKISRTIVDISKDILTSYDDWNKVFQ